MADVSRKQTTEQRTRLTSHVIWKSSDICMTIILSNVIGCCDKIVALLARFGRFFVFVKETAKNIPCLCIHIFRIQCFSFLAMSSPPTNCTIPRLNFHELSDTFSAWYTWEAIELIASGALDFDYSHIILFFLSVIFLRKKQKWNADNEFKKQGNWNLV